MDSSHLIPTHDRLDLGYDLFVDQLMRLCGWYGMAVLPPSRKDMDRTPTEWCYLELKGGQQRKMRADEFKVGDRYNLNSSEQMYVAVKNDKGHEVVEVGPDFVVFEKGQGARLRVPAYLFIQPKEGES